MDKTRLEHIKRMLSDAKYKARLNVIKLSDFTQEDLECVKYLRYSYNIVEEPHKTTGEIVPKIKVYLNE